MILEKLGVLSTAQDLLAGTTDSENVIDLGAVANVGLNEVYLSIETETVESGADTDTYVIDLVLATEATLDTYYKILSIVMTGADPRLATAGRAIANCEIGHMLGELLDGSYRYLGLMSTLADVGGTAAVSINAALSPSKPGTKLNTQEVRSNVTVPS